MPKAPPTRSAPSTKWHAVCVVCQPTGCEEAKKLQRVRFLSKDAPRLPLHGCSTPDSCRCSYKHYQDRRGQPRRSDELSGVRRAYKSAERRNKSDRRESD